jgi:flagellar hook-length control protein FliK
MSSVYHSTARAGIGASHVAPEPARERSARPFEAFLASSNRSADFSLQPNSRGGPASKRAAPPQLDESFGKRRGRVRDETHQASRRNDAQYTSAATPADASEVRSVDRDASVGPADDDQAADADAVTAADSAYAARDSAVQRNDDSHEAPQATTRLAATNPPSIVSGTEATAPDLVEQTGHQPNSNSEGPQATIHVVAAGELTGQVSVTTPFQSESGGLDPVEDAAGATAEQQLTWTEDSRAGRPIEATLTATDPASTVDASSQAALTIASGDPAARQDAPSTAEARGDRRDGLAAQAARRGIRFNPADGLFTIPESSPPFETVIDVSATDTAADEARISDGMQQAGSTTASPGSDLRGEGRNALSGRIEQDAAAGKGALGPADAGRFVLRVSRAVELANQRGESLQIRLSPPELGSLRVEIAVRGGVLTAHLEAETQAARIALLDNLPALRERLAEQSVRVERFDVDVRDESGGRFHERAPSFDDLRRSTPQRPHREPRNIPATMGAGPSGPRQVPTHLGGGRINLLV